MFEEMSNMQIIRPMNFAALGLGAAFTVVYGVADPMAAFAETREVEAEGYYRMGDGMEERMDIAQQRAIEDATRKAAEKAGVFVESFSATYMGQITRDEVRAIAATVLDVKEPVKVIPEVFADGQAIRYHAFVTAVVDTANIEKMLNKSGDDKADMVRRNKEMEEELAKVNAEIERLKAEHQRATEAEKQRINEEVKQNERRFEAIEWNQRGRDYKRQGRFDEAMECFRKSAEIDSTLAFPWINIGDLVWLTDGAGAAIEFFQKAAEVDPTLSDSWSQLGKAYIYYLREDQKAVECLQRAVELDPNDEFAVYHLGLAYDNLHDYDNAIEYAQKAVELNPNNGQYWQLLGGAYGGAGNYEKCMECYKRALEIKPDDYCFKNDMEYWMEKFGEAE